MSSSSAAMEVPSHRSCASCRSHKVRCIPDENNPAACQRCVRARRECVFTPVQRRKQRVRTDTRVAELEKEMRAMRAALKQKEEETMRPASPPNTAATASTTAQPPSLWYKDSLSCGPVPVQGTAREQAQSIPAPAPMAQRKVMSAWPEAEGVDDLQDVVGKGIVSMASARLLVDCYRTHLFPQFPIIAIPADMTAERLRETKPTLFLAVLAAAAYKDNSPLSTTLDKEVLQAYATRSLVQSEKSLELVQALLISATWYNPPAKFGHLKYYEYMHMAASMAMDIGIGSRNKTRRVRTHRLDGPSQDSFDQNPQPAPRRLSSSWDVDSMESRRTYLACYIQCTSVSFILRRPIMLRTTNYIRECVDMLEKYGEFPTDPILVAWARLCILCETIGSALGYQDGGTESIADVRTQIMVKCFAKELSKWRANAPDLPGGREALFMMYYNIRLCLFELVLHVEHCPDDFRAPYQMGVVHQFEPEDADDIPVQVLAEGIAECISSAHAAIDTFVSLNNDSLQSLPPFGHVRTIGAAFILAKLCVSAVHPQGRIGSVLDRTSLKVDYYMDRILSRVRCVLAKQPTRACGLVIALLSELQKWCIDPSAMNRNFQLEMEESSKAEILDHDEELERVAVIKLEGPGPRVEELMASPAVSPAEQNETQTERPIPIPQPPIPDHVAPVSADMNMSLPDYPNFLGSELNHSNFTNTASGRNDPDMPFNTNNHAYIQPMSSMDLEGDPFQMMGDMSAFSGGLTGLEQWGDLPADLTGMGDMGDMGDMNWTMGSTNFHQQGGPF